MKKISALVLALVLVLSLFAGCSKNALVGTWEGKADISEVMAAAMTQVLGEGVEFTPDAVYLHATITMNKDGTYSLEFDEDETTQSVLAMIDGMQDTLVEAVYQALEAQGVTREQADIAIMENSGLSIAEYVESEIESMKDSLDLDLASSNASGKYETKDGSLTLRSEEGDEILQYTLKGDSLTLSLDAGFLGENELFSGIDKIDFAFTRVG